MSTMLRSYKILRLLPRINRINHRSGYQHLQTSIGECRQSANLVGLARTLTTYPISATSQPSQEEDAYSMGQQQQQRQFRPVRGRMQMDVQTLLRQLDEQIQRTGRLTEERLRNVFQKVCNSESVTPNQALLLIRSCGSLLAELPFEKRNELVTQVWDKLANLGVHYDVFHYNALLWVYLENEFKFSPTEFMSQMESKGIEPNRVTYQRLISVYCRQGDIKGATLILEVLRSKDLPVTESVFNSLILGNARAGDMDSAKNMINVMRNMGLDPSLDTYTALACAYAEKGDIENVNLVMDEAVSNGFTLTPSFYFKLVHSLTTHGYKEHVNQFLDKVELAGSIPDAINLSLSLWTQGYYEESFAVLKTFTTLRDREGRCTFFIHHMMGSSPKPSTEALLGYLDQMEALGLHGNPHIMALSHSVQDTELANDMSIALMKRMKERGMPIRPHYFWPLLVKEKQNPKGVLELLRTMVDMDVKMDSATYIDYVLPALKGDAASILAQVQEAGIQPDDHLFVVLCRKHLLSERHNAPEEVLKLCESHPQLPLYVLFRKSVSSYFASARRPNNAGLVKLLKLIGAHDGEGKPADELEMGSEESNMEGEQESSLEHQEDEQRDLYGFQLYNMVESIKPQDAARMNPILENLFKSLAAEGMYVSLRNLRGIRRLLHSKLRLRRLTGVLQTLANPEEIMADPLLNTDFMDNMPHDELASLLESGLKELNEKGEDTGQVLRKLISVVAAQNNTEKANELVQEYESKGYVKSGIMFKNLILMHCRNGNMEEALKLKKELEQQFDSLNDNTVFKEIIVLFVEKGKLEEAFQMIQEMHTSVSDTHPRGSYLMEDVVEKVLESTAEAGMETETRELLERCVGQGIVKPTRALLKPLIDVYLVKNDLPGAVKAVKEIASRYHIYPSDQDMLVKLVDSGNKELLQEAIRDLSDSKGEVNMIFSLAFAFLENKKFEEASKLFKAPGIEARMDRLNWFANRCLDHNLDETLEKFVDLTEGVYGCDRDTMYYHLMRLYGDNQKNPDKCLEVYYRMQEEDLIPSARTLRFLADILEGHNKPVPYEVPKEKPAAVQRQRRPQQPAERRENQMTTEREVQDITPKREEINIPIDPSLSALDQVKVLVNDYDHSANSSTDYRREITRQVRRCVEEDSFETFLSVKEVCQQIPEFTSTNGFKVQEAKACMANNDLKGAHNVFDDMLDRDKRPNRDLIALLAEKYAEAGQVETILQMKQRYGEVVRRGAFPGNGFVLGAYVKRNDIAGALKFMEDSIAASVTVSQLGLRYFFNKMIENNIPLDSVMEFIEHHYQQGEFVPAKSLVYSYMYSDKVEEAKALIEKNPQLKGCLLNYTNQLAERRDVPVDKIQRVLETSDVDGTDRTIVYSCLLRGYDKKRDWEGAMQVRANMAAENLKMSEADLKRLAILLRNNGQPVPFVEPPMNLNHYTNQREMERSEQ